ncbi:MAG: hypothetical protein ACRC2T_11460 [Thermoguttaceae bacterium]
MQKDCAADTKPNYNRKLHLHENETFNAQCIKNIVHPSLTKGDLYKLVSHRNYLKTLVIGEVVLEINNVFGIRADAVIDFVKPINVKDFSFVILADTVGVPDIPVLIDTLGILFDSVTTGTELAIKLVAPITQHR